MESLGSSWNKANVNDPKYRMAARPQSRASSTSTTKDLRRQTGGQVAENHGSDFARGAAQRTAKPTPKANSKHRNISALNSDSDSTDPLDSLPPSRAGSRAGSEIEFVDEKKKEEKNGYVDEKGVRHPYNSAFQKTNVLKGLKFKKNKAPNNDQPSDASSSQSPVLKDQRNEPDSTPRRPMPLPVPSQSNVRRNRSPPPRRSPSPARRPSKPTVPPPRADPPSESTRPKPRRLNPDASSTRKPQEFPHPSPIPRSPARRATVSVSSFRTQSSHTPPKPSENADPGKQSTIKKPKIADFPLSPVRGPAKFPSIDSPGSPKKSKAADFPPLSPCRAPALFPLDVLDVPEVVAVKKLPGKRSVSEKIALIKPPPPRQKTDKPSAETRIRKRLSTGSGPGAGQATKARRRIVESEEESEEEVGPKAQPFPMSTQMLDSIGPPPSFAATSNLKRSPSDSYEEPDSKRLREDDIDFSISVDYNGTGEQDVDPNTLCPYCDAPLPSQRTPQLLHLLATAEKKSHREPRLGNRLGRTAPFTVYIAVCQRHEFESEMLPEAERMGWPKTIDWTRLGKRVKKMKGVLRAIIDDNGAGDSDDSDDLFGDSTGGKNDALSRPRERCVFWKEAMEEIRKKGTRAAAGIHGQFASFEKLQPGYYGEMGSVIIHQTLYDLFPPASIDPESVSPLTANEFLQRIMVPEVAVRLIMQDMDLDESRMDDAVKVLRESANYGVAMFPADEGEGEAADEGELGAADVILMQRAMKRRKELDIDEEGEEEEYVRLMAKQEEEEKERQEREREREKRLQKKAKEKDQNADNTISSPQVANSRPRPRPLGKSASSASLADLRMPSSSFEQSHTDVEDVHKPVHGRPKPRRLPSQSQIRNSERDEAPSPQGRKAQPFPLMSSHLNSDVEDGSPAQRKPAPLPVLRKAKPLGTFETDATPRKPSACSVRASSPLEISSSDDPTDDEWDLGRMKKKKRDCKIPTATSDDDGEAVEPVPPSSSLRTPPFSERQTTQDSEEETPKPRRSLALEARDYYDTIPPLEKAQLRKNKASSTHIHMQNKEKESHSWLLSDNSQSSSDSNQ
ncbi:hypothetical protein H0H92_002197 [Tricholoma furcatifolium]|nr:hypothetical protein H0H92_002197 [Tricholoma furcatifolium]